MSRKKLSGVSGESMDAARDKLLALLEEHEEQGWALVPGVNMEYDHGSNPSTDTLGNRYMIHAEVKTNGSTEPSEETKAILYLRRRALLMELALIEDELGIERSVKRK